METNLEAAAKDVWERNGEGKFIIPRTLQNEFYVLADGEIENWMGLLTNRSSVRRFAIEMLAKGYQIRMDEQISSTQNSQNNEHATQ